MSATGQLADVALIRVAGDGGQAPVAVDCDGITVGSAPDCGLVLDDRGVAARHLHLTALPSGALLLNDLDLERGVWVDDERVTCAVLRGDEHVRVGDTVLEVQVPERGPEPIARDAPIVRTATPSMLERVRLRRSVHRATILAGAALVAALLVGVGFLTGVLGGGSTDAQVASVVARATASTVLVQAQDGDRRTANGTGWVLDAKTGLVVTNAHVLNAGDSFTVGVGDSLRLGSVVGVSACEDLAVLRVDDASGMRTLPLGTQRDLRQGQSVVAVGFPGNASLSDSLTSTVGVVSVVRNEYREPALDVPHLSDVVQTDAAINPGNSGGPLLTLDGRLVGVNSAGRTLNASGRIIQGQSYAIGVDRVRQVIAGLRGGTSQGWYGLGFKYLSDTELRRRGLPQGILISNVVAGTPAARARVRPGRSLLTAVDGRPVSNSLAGYCDAVSQVPADADVRLSGVDVRTAAPWTQILRRTGPVPTQEATR
jgi:S1-C subfamily serine protease